MRATPERRGCRPKSRSRVPICDPAPTDADPVEINVAFGTEKQHWLEEATAEFQKSPTGRGIKVNLHGMGSMEAARAVIDGPNTDPDSGLGAGQRAYRDAFEREWHQHANLPIIKVENLALTPMVFVTWVSRHQPFLKKFSKLTFRPSLRPLASRGDGEPSTVSPTGGVSSSAIPTRPFQ